MASAHSIGGGTNGVVGTTVAYWAALVSIPKYPFTPPPKVDGNAAVLAFN